MFIETVQSIDDSSSFLYQSVEIGMRSVLPVSANSIGRRRAEVHPCSRLKWPLAESITLKFRTWRIEVFLLTFRTWLKELWLCFFFSWCCCDHSTEVASTSMVSSFDLFRSRRYPAVFFFHGLLHVVRLSRFEAPGRFSTWILVVSNENNYSNRNFKGLPFCSTPWT